MDATKSCGVCGKTARTLYQHGETGGITVAPFMVCVPCGGDSMIGKCVRCGDNHPLFIDMAGLCEQCSPGPVCGDCSPDMGDNLEWADDTASGAVVEPCAVCGAGGRA